MQHTNMMARQMICPSLSSPSSGCLLLGCQIPTFLIVGTDTMGLHEPQETGFQWDFNDCHAHGNLGSPGANTPLIATSTPQGSIMSASQKELANFKKGTKRDGGINPILKSEEHYDSFHRAFHANENAQRLSSIVDPKFK